ncbi:hypothetical protein CDAR_177331 [Caerostris darwini]|uniref:Uncharacterized protein n=1 Tax=Caerostris darwini TaxID=1538125 RepID=A0AAV4P1L4_9ARAC|nr:hypothetical protein CDAR_177331 [Caerostris darwini]
MNAHFVKLNPRTESKNCRLLIMTLETNIYVRVKISLPSSLVFFDGGHYKTPFDAAEKYYLANGGGDYFNKLLFHLPCCNFRLFCRNYLPFPKRNVLLRCLRRSSLA